jgi:hypothetical protein
VVFDIIEDGVIVVGFDRLANWVYYKQMLDTINKKNLMMASKNENLK